MRPSTSRDSSTHRKQMACPSVCAPKPARRLAAPRHLLLESCFLNESSLVGLTNLVFALRRSPPGGLCILFWRQLHEIRPHAICCLCALERSQEFLGEILLQV